MPNPLADLWSFDKAAASSGGVLLVAAYSDESLKSGVPQTYLLQLDGARLGIVAELDEYVRSIQPIADGFAAVTEDGAVVLVRDGVAEAKRQVPSGSKGGPVAGPVRDSLALGDRVLLVGLNGTAVEYRLSTDSFHDASDGLDSARTDGIEALAGRAGGPVFGVDLHGGIWGFDGRRWRDAPSPTNLMLNCICVTSVGTFYAAGRHGVVVRGSGDSWEELDLGLRSFDIYSVGESNGVVYFAGPRGLMSFDEQKQAVEAVDLEPIAIRSFYRVVANGEFLWSIGAKDIALRRGGTWMSLFL